MGSRLVGAALHYLGHQKEARGHLELTTTRYVAPERRSHLSRFHYDQIALARLTLSNVLWLQGLPDQAVLVSGRALDDARAGGHVLSLCTVLVRSSCPIALYVGDLSAMERFLTMLDSYLTQHMLPVWKALAHCMHGMLRLERGEIGGLTTLRHSLDELQKVRFVTRYPAFACRLAQGFYEHGMFVEASSTIEEALKWAEAHEEHWCLPELMRTKGDLLRVDSSPAAAEAYYSRALETARKQDALSWELRAAMSLAKLWSELASKQAARELLASVYNRFTEGFETRDLKRARGFMQTI
jgi:hypothetical protein